MEKSQIPKRNIKPPGFSASALTASCSKKANGRDVPPVEPAAAAKAYLRRRSKSVTDLRPPASRPNFKQTMANLRSAALPPLRSIENARSVKSGAAGLAAGQKRAGATKAPPEVSQPKRARIPDWDYKSKFQDLLGKHNVLKDTLKTRNEELGRAIELEEENSQLKKDIEILPVLRAEINEQKGRIVNLEDENASLKLRLTRLAEVEAQLGQLQLKYAQLEAENQHQQDDLVKLQTHGDGLQKELEAAQNFNSQLQKELQEQHLLRRIQHNAIQDLKGNIRVFCRVRPPINNEAEDRLICNINTANETTIELKRMRESMSLKTGRPTDLKQEFTFDRVFDSTSTQLDVFEELSQLVQSALDGYNVCVFAYGQTGSGKTYTMQGGATPAEFGIIPRTSALIFKTIAQLEQSNWNYQVQVSCLEIYNENIRDLLGRSPNVTHELRYNDGQNVTVTNLTTLPVTSPTALDNLMLIAQRNRAVAATNFNEHSSRSHAVTRIHLRGRNVDSDITYESVINLIDLAGSESAKTSERLTETKNINKSLSTLGNVLLALCNKDSHVPYRDSKLTFLLQPCLGGNSKTLMFVNISPFDECFGETVNSLRFATKVKEIKQTSRRNKYCSN